MEWMKTSIVYLLWHIQTVLNLLSLVTIRTLAAWARRRAIALTTCSALPSCISGATCSFYVTVNKAPRSRCETQGGENCCMSWSDYQLQAGFFRGESLVKKQYFNSHSRTFSRLTKSLSSSFYSQNLSYLDYLLQQSS